MQLLSDRRPSFLSKLLLSVCECLGLEKINTSAYHPQTDGLVEHFNCMLLDMLAKSVSHGVSEWNEVVICPIRLQSLTAIVHW